MSSDAKLGAASDATVGAAAPELPDHPGLLNEATLRDLYGAYRAVKRMHYDGTAGYSKPELAAAWRAIMLTYPEVLAAARIGLDTRELARQLVNSDGRSATGSDGRSATGSDGRSATGSDGRSASGQAAGQEAPP